MNIPYFFDPKGNQGCIGIINIFKNETERGGLAQLVRAHPCDTYHD